MTSKITSMNSILMIDWLNSSLIKSTKSTYHLVTFKCSKKKYQNKAYGSEQIIYDRYRDKTRNIMNELFNDYKQWKMIQTIW